MTVESGTVCELGTYRLWDFVVSSLPAGGESADPEG